MRSFALFLFCLLPLPALAQSASDDRIDQLERQILLLETKIDRSGANIADAPHEPAIGVGTAQTDVRVTNLEEELRKLRGTLEEKEFENRHLAEAFEKFKRDTEFRLTDIEKHSAAVAPVTDNKLPVAPAPPETPADKKTSEKPLSKQEIKEKLEVSVKEEPREPKLTVEAEEAAGPAGFETPRDHYNYAFRLLNQNQYDEAARHLTSFTKKHGKDPLVGNAYYWLGETYYIRKDFANAADQFRQGFEALPKGPKAGDNLLKLGMSLAALKKNEEACVVLSQVMNKFKTANAKVAAKAEAEHKRVGCE